ncbi:MAG: membrane protein insertase YidC [Actinobacteria bacterium]|nr:MAG: membrane protein insertase YidC [Actinomycetota bacterium]
MIAQIAEAWKGVTDGLAQILIFFHGFLGDYGLAIILLTVLVRLALLPLTIKQTRSMQDMQRVQPMLKKLQEKYKDDKQKLQEEMMKFYQEHKVNPLGGCLPMLLQLPIMFALFSTLNDPKLLQQQPFLFFVPNLSARAGQFGLPPTDWLSALPYIVLVILMVVTTYLPQKMLAADAQQNKMMVFMSLFMAYIAWQLPAGVILYWVTTNIWTMGQQYIMIKAQGPSAPASKGA